MYTEEQTTWKYDGHTINSFHHSPQFAKAMVNILSSVSLKIIFINWKQQQNN